MQEKAKSKSLIEKIRRSIWRNPWPQNDRERLRLTLQDLFLHLHPPRFAKRSLQLTYSYALGVLAIVLFLMLAVTGMLLMFAYTPSPDEAYASMEALKSEVWLGQLVRNLHHWSGNLLLIVAVLHMLRVFYTATFHPPREFNWILGLILLALIAMSNFTGYLMPWDQLSYWAVTIATSMLNYIPLIGEDISRLLLGGSEVGASTLRTFFAFHVVIFPPLMVIIISYHIWRIRKDTYSIPRRVDEPPLQLKDVEKVTTVPHVIAIEVGLGLTLVALMIVWAMLRDAPLLEAADPNHPPNPAKAAWYFMGFQELLLHFHPTFVTVVIPGLAIIGLLLLPYIDVNEERDDPNVIGIWFRSIKGRRLVILSSVLGVLITTLLVIWDEHWLNLPELLDFLPSWISNGLVPVSILMLGLVGYYVGLRRRGATTSESNMALFSLLFFAFVTLTIIGVYFRGEDMVLVYPWEGI